MPELEPVGRRPKGQRKTEPVIVPVVGYNLDDEEVVFNLVCRPSIPLGIALDITRQSHVNAKGQTIVPTSLALEYIDLCVSPEIADDWKAFLNSPDVMVDLETLADIYRTLSGYYTDRPSTQRSSSPNGVSPTKRTSSGVARGRASTSMKSRSTKG